MAESEATSNVPNPMNASYNWKAVPEASWYALGAGAGTLIGSLLVAYTGISEAAVVPIVAAITPLPRILIGFFLPFPPTTGAHGDKSS